MPVGIVLVVDQDYIQDVLLAFANSPLRFQITQVEWTRFRGPLSGVGPSSSGNDANSVDYQYGSVAFGSGLPGGGSSALGPKLLGPRVGSAPGGARNWCAAAADWYAADRHAAGRRAPIGMPGSYGPPGMGNPYGSSGNSSTVSESQITSGLVELNIFGIVSLYEKYTEPKKADAAATPGNPGQTPGSPSGARPDSDASDANEPNESDPEKTPPRAAVNTPLRPPTSAAFGVIRLAAGQLNQNATNTGTSHGQSEVQSERVFTSPG